MRVSNVKQRGVMAAANKLASETKYVDGKKVLTTLKNVEATDSDWTSTEINPTTQAGTNYLCLPIPTPGDGYYSRDGRKIYVRNIRIRGIIEFPAMSTTGDTQEFARIIAVRNNRTNGLEIVGEEIINEGTDAAGTHVASADAGIMSATNPNGWGHYQVLQEKIIRRGPQTLYGTTAIASVKKRVPFKMNIKCGFYINFSSDTASVAAVIDNSVGLLGAASDANVKISYLARTAFVG